MIQKYRVWDKQRKSFCKDDDCYVVDGAGKLYYTYDHDSPRDPRICIEEEPENDRFILVYSTGRKDSCGAKIFEGDILQDGDYLMLVELDRYGWYLKQICGEDGEDESGYLSQHDTTGVSKIIGNKFENPSILAQYGML